MPVFEGLGKALRWLREKQEKRQYQVAQVAGITKAMLSAYETGKQKPSLDTLEKVLNALGCDLSDLTHALDFVNERPVASRAGIPSPPDAGPRSRLFSTAPDIYSLLGLHQPLPAAVEASLAEMLQGFHRLLRFMVEASESGVPPEDPGSRPL